MLIEFRVENHRSLRDEQVLSMEAGRVGDDQDPRLRRVPGHLEPLLPVAALYGANASGKSNVLAALEFMREAVIQSHRRWRPDIGIPIRPFGWGPKRTEPSFFECAFLLNSVRHEYGFLASSECFREEWLYSWPNGRKQVWFERDGTKFKFGENFKGENRVIERITRPNALFLSAGVQLKHQQMYPVFSWFRSLRSRMPSSPITLSSSQSRGLFSLARLLDKDDERFQQLGLFPSDEEPTATLLDRFLALLSSADMGIVDVELQKSDSEGGYRNSPWPKFRLKHRAEFEDAWLPLSQESRGTQTLFRIALPILQSLQQGTILIVDELDASLHPALAQEIVRQFNDPATNPNNAQLIFTTHDTNLLGTTLGEPALRRDQVWLTEKDPEGATVLYPLTDYKPRKNENLERGYLQGRYGAIPFLGDFQLLGSETP